MAIQRDIFQDWSDEMAYALGFIYADGCLFKNPRGSEYLEIVSSDSEIINKLRKILTSDNKVGVQIRARGKVGGYLYKKTGCFELVFARRDGLAISDFMYHNVPSRSYLMRKRVIFREIELRA